MASLPAKAEDPVEPFEWDLRDVQIWCFQFLHDLKYLDFQTGQFSGFE